VHLRLACDPTSVLIEVWDSVPRPPAARRPRPDEEHGRGLALIQALSDRWGWTTVPGWPGKVAWAELRPGWEGPGGPVGYERGGRIRSLAISRMIARRAPAGETASQQPELVS